MKGFVFDINRHAAKTDEGAVLAELAASVLLLMLVFSSIVGFGSFMTEHKAMQESARLAAEIASHSASFDQLASNGIKAAHMALKQRGLQPCRYYIEAQAEPFPDGVYLRVDIQRSAISRRALAKVAAFNSDVSAYFRCDAETDEVINDKKEQQPSC